MIRVSYSAKLHILHLVLCVLAATAAGCRVRKPIIKIHDVRLGSLGTGKLNMVFEFNVFNTNWFDANLKTFEYTAGVSGVEFIRGDEPERVGKFKALEWRTFSVPATVKVSKAVEAIRRAKGADTLECELKGKAVFTVLGIDIPVKLDKKVAIRRPQAPKWKFVRIRMPRKFSDPVRLVFNVTNPNSFPLPMSALAGKVTVGGVEIVRIAQPAAEPIDPQSTREVTFAMKVSLTSLNRAVLKSLLAGEKVKFDGDFKLDPPISLRKRLSRGVQKE